VREWYDETVRQRGQRELGKLFEVTRDPVPIVLWISPQFDFQQESFAEQAITALFRQLCSRHCRDKHSLVLDMGANEGVYAMLASAYGCRVISFEPQPGCVRPLAGAIGLNRIEPAVDLRQRVVTADEGFSVRVPDKTCRGTAHYGGPRGFAVGERDTPVPLAEQDDSVLVEAQALDSVVCDGDNLLLWHVDVEAHETAVLDSGAQLITTRRARNLIIEWTPSKGPTWNGVAASEWIRWGRAIDAAGYACYSLSEGLRAGGTLARDWQWAGKDHDVFCTLQEQSAMIRVKNL
jgi:FkbM family methyltransferase